MAKEGMITFPPLSLVSVMIGISRAASLSKDEAMLLGYFRSVKNPEKILEFSEKLFNEENGQD